MTVIMKYTLTLTVSTEKSNKSGNLGQWVKVLATEPDHLGLMA